MGPTRLVLHLGAHKTASTHFCQLLMSNTHLTAPYDLAVPPKPPVRDLVTGRLRQKDGPLDPQVWAKLAEGARNLLVSDENILGTTGRLIEKQRIYAHARKRLMRLRDACQDIPDVSLMLAIRNPATFMVSSYGEALRFRGYLTFDEFRNSARLREVSWLNFIGRVQVAMPDVPLVVWRYEEYHSVLPQVLRTAVGADHDIDAAGLPNVSQVVRPGLSQRAVDEIKTYTQTCSGELDRQIIAQIVERYPRSAELPGITLWNDAQFARATKFYEDDIAQIADLDNVTMLSA